MPQKAAKRPGGRLHRKRRSWRRRGHTVDGEFLDAPVITEFPPALKCELLKMNEDGNIIGRIINVSANKCVLNESGEVDPSKLKAISFDPCGSTCVQMGEVVGKAFQDGGKLK